MSYTYRQLLYELLLLSEEALNNTATVLQSDEEFISVQGMAVSGQETDSLDEGHPYLYVTRE